MTINGIQGGIGNIFRGVSYPDPLFTAADVLHHLRLREKGIWENGRIKSCLNLGDTVLRDVSLSLYKYLTVV